MGTLIAETATTTADGGALKLDSITIVDLRLLSQSELYSLSLCASSTFDPCRRDDVVIPNIDRSVFNESAGSRKQTYSRLRLAPPSSSSSATPRRRTPHLRTATAFSNANNNSDPENAENGQIVTLLKQLFVTDVNYEELVPVKIDYSLSLPPHQFSSFPPSSPSNVGPTGLKRKRGRPRKNEVLVSEEELAVGASVVDVNVDEGDGFSVLNEIVLHENAEDMDREIVNKDGVSVDLVALGVVEHPYLEEISCRTEGLGTEEQLLGYLEGLNGQWGSRRKKKRIVDANEFGGVLPIGWKLLLSIKKKNGQVWLYCRRYISPSGLYFVSCKGVSSYLLSLHGVHNTNPHCSTQHNEIVTDADKLTSVPVAELAAQDAGRKESLVSHASSLTIGSTSGSHEMQVVINAGDLPQDRVEEVLRCNKCNITFSEKDELLQHRSSVHRRNRYTSGMRITDGVIIKDGKYECQFCHKTFSERHRYNGHVGTHVRYQAKIAGESPAESVDHSSFSEFPLQGTMVEGSLKSDNDVEISNLITNNGPKDNEHVGDLKEANGNMRGVDEATDMVIERNPCAVAEVIFSGNENKSFHEDSRVSDCAVEIIGDVSSSQARGHGNWPLDDSHGVMEGSAIENSASIEKPDQSVVSKSCLLDSDYSVEECDIVVNNEPTCQTRNELKLDYENFAVNGSVFDFFGCHGDQDKDLAASIKQHSDFESMPSKNICTSEKTSTSGSMASELTKDPNIITQPISHDEKACFEDKLTHSIGTHIGTCENGSSKAGNDGVSTQMQFGISSAIPFWNKQEKMPKKDDTEPLTFVLKEPGAHNASKNRVIPLSGNHAMYGYENNSREVCGRNMEVPDFNDFQNVRNGQSSNHFNSNHAGLNSNSVTGTEQDRKLGACSALTSETDKQFFTEDNMISMFNDALEDHKQDPTGGILLSQPGVSEVCHEAYTLNKIYTTPANLSRFSEIEDSGKHELSLSFGNRQMELRTDSNRVRQGRYQADNVNVQSLVRKTYGDQTHLSMINSSTPGDLKQGRAFGIDFPHSSFSNRTSESGNGFNVGHLERDWNGHRREKTGTSGQNFMVGFENSNLQSGECVTADGSWRKGRENVFQGSFNAASDPQIPASNCFRTFDLTSNKGEDSSFGVNKNYDICTDMLRPGRPQPVEYSFMGEQSSTSLPGESKMFSFTANMEQGLDPSFWLGKDALMPNSSHTSQVTSVCVWCRNMFFQDPVQAGMQTGAIGTMCPSCSSRIPGQFNVL